MEAITEKIAGLLVDRFLQYPVTCAVVFTIGHALFGPLFRGNDPGIHSWRKWVLLNAAAFSLAAVTLAAAMPRRPRESYSAPRQVAPRSTTPPDTSASF